MEISFCSHPNTNKVIATIFGTWHDSWAVVACAKFCCDMVISNWIRAKWNFHRIWIVMEKSLVKWAPDVNGSGIIIRINLDEVLWCYVGVTRDIKNHYDDVTMGGMAFQITSLTIVYSTVYSGADQRKHQSPASLAFVRGIHRGPVNSPHKWSVTRKLFPFDDVIMIMHELPWITIFGSRVRRFANNFHESRVKIIGNSHHGWPKNRYSR